MKDAHLNLRVSQTLRDLVGQGGEQSASARALLIIGAATAGLDMSAMQLEVLDLMSARLRPEVCAQLLAIAAGSVRPAAPAVLHTAPLHDDSRAADTMDDVDVLGDADGAGFDV